MKLSKKLSQTSAEDAGIVYFIPKVMNNLWVAELEKLKSHPQLSQILTNFEQEQGLPAFTEGSAEEILNARIYRYAFVSRGWDNAISPDELTHAATWTAFAAA